MSELKASLKNNFLFSIFKDDFRLSLLISSLVYLRYNESVAESEVFRAVVPPPPRFFSLRRRPNIYNLSHFHGWKLLALVLLLVNSCFMNNNPYLYLGD